MTRRAAIAAAVLALALVSSARAQAPPFGVPPPGTPPPGTPGTYILVPRAGGYVYVPLDASGMPAGAPGSGSGPSAPAVPRAPSMPSVPSPPGGIGGVGYLQMEIDPAGADVLIDGRRAGAADPVGRARTLFTLEAGLHDVEVTREGFKTLTTEIRIVPGVVFAIRGRLEPD